MLRKEDSRLHQGFIQIKKDIANRTPGSQFRRFCSGPFGFERAISHFGSFLRLTRELGPSCNEQILQLFQLIGVRRADEAKPKTVRRFVLNRTGCFQYSTTYCPGGFEIHRIVECHKRLKRRIASWPAERTDFAVWRIESGHGGIRAGSTPFDVERASIAIFAFTGFPIKSSTKSGVQAE